MAEQLVNEFTVNRPIDEAWAVVTDVERIAPCLPGAQLQEVEGDTYRGVVRVKLGSISPNIKGQASFVDRDDSEHRAVLKAEGRDTGGRGNASAEITAQAVSVSPTSTRVVVTTHLAITGKMAQFGRGIIGDVSKKLMGQFASNLNAMLDDDAGPNASAGSTEPREATPAPPQRDEVSASNPEHTVRKVDSPVAEPVDLAAVAAPAILKRLGPIVAVALVMLLLVRRLR
jgi:carbon monoxide dehydrogenase subunit G